MIKGKVSIPEHNTFEKMKKSLTFTRNKWEVYVIAFPLTREQDMLQEDKSWNQFKLDFISVLIPQTTTKKISICNKRS